MSYELRYVIDKLKAGNVRFDVSQNSEDSAAVVLPDYNRILGVWPDVNKPSPLWINEKFLENPNDKSTDWANPGGHRIWVAPEKEFSISDLDNPFGSYKVPEQIDPGRHEYKHNEGIYSFSNHAELYAHRSKVKVPLSYERKIRLLEKQEISEVVNIDHNEYKCVAYQDDVLLKTETDFMAGVWSLVQVPLEGQIYLPVGDNARYEALFGESEGLIEIDDNLLKIKLNPIKNEFKLGLIASSVEDRIAHVRNDGDKTMVVLMIFEKGRDSDYIDTPWKQNDVPGAAVQIFCGADYGFAELEVHAPAVKEGSVCCSHLKSRVFIIEISKSSGIDVVSKLLTPS